MIRSGLLFQIGTRAPTPSIKLDTPEGPLTMEEKHLITETYARGRKLDIMGLCIENPAFLRLQDKGIVTTKDDDDRSRIGHIVYWELTPKGQKIAEQLKREDFAHIHMV